MLTHHLGWWGEREIPVVSPSAGGDVDIKAEQAASTLKEHDIATKIVKEYSAHRKTTFIGMRDEQGIAIKSGDRIGRDEVVTVRESLGPGVPKGTVGQSRDKAETVAKSMRVPVHVKTVTLLDSGKTKPGTVIASEPADGQPVVDESKGIYLAVVGDDGADADTGSDNAAGESTVPIDLVGMSPADARRRLESKGYQVIVKPRFSSKRYLNKVAASDPAAGERIPDGGLITLYYGVGADKMWDVFTLPASGNMPDTQRGVGDFVAGRYCTIDGDCLTLDVKAGYTLDYNDDIVVNGGAVPLSACANIQAPCPTPKEGAEAERAGYGYRFIMNRNWGMFEMLPHSDLAGYYCGDTPASFNGVGQECVNGQLKSWDELPNGANTKISGARYEMGDFYVYFTVGSQIDKLEASGYFDKDELADAAKDKPVDRDRPFILVRDKTRYSTTTQEIGGGYVGGNPFIPGSSSLKSTMVPMKPAPSNSSVYYLEEGVDALDWDALPDAKATSAEAESSAHRDYSVEEITKAADRDNFAPIAGTYCTKDDSCVSLDAKGVIRGVSGGGKSFKTTRLTADRRKSQWMTYVKGQPGYYIDLEGPESDYVCGVPDKGRIRGLRACLNEGAPESSFVERPISVLYIFKNTKLEPYSDMSPFDRAQGNRGAFDTSRPCLYFMGWHMNPAPNSETAYYLRE
ncbi:PASTA domain-containing protein [Bifidobacterium jacchi]|uniref:PASTA domain-containing protein n=1 Tax=Bifidobacterium jacchi TaxID=2490545 RepID=UPI0015882514|nr:PASTA domain-containing protein [Bifidobacterium jacchi]